MFDSHAHTHFAAFESDYREVIRRALDKGVGMINVGTQLDTSRRAIEVAHEFENERVFASVGLHPIHTTASYHDAKELGGGEAAKAFTSRGEEFDKKEYLKLAKDHKVVAIGECGLDYYRLETGSESQVASEIEKQKEVFKEHIEIAKETGKALMIHCRPSKGTDDAYEDLLEIITNYKVQIPKVLHFYVGSAEMTKKFLGAGFNFEFGGVITFSRDYDEQIKMIPLDRILLETDAPYVAPEPYRGRRNEPAYVVEVAKRLAAIKNVEYNELERTIDENARKVFKI